MGAGLRYTFFVGVGIASCSAAARAQSGEAVRAQRVRGESFLLVRYATGGATSLYAAARIGRASVLAGLSGNRETGKFTPIVGAGTRLHLGTRLSTGVFLAVAGNSGDRQARVYMLPRAASGPIAVTAIAMLSRQVRTGARQVSVNPVMAGLRVAPWLQVGGATVAERIGQPSSRVTAGPAAHVRLMGAVLSIEALAPRATGQAEYRVSVSVR